MDIPSAITLIAAALLLPRFLPHPRFVLPRAQYALPHTETNPDPDDIRFSLLVPVAHNPDIGGTFGELLRSPRQDFEILLLVQTGDLPSLMSAYRLAERHPYRVRVLEGAWLTGQTVAHALNHGLRNCAGELTGVIDPGDPIRASLLDRVDGAFRRAEADVVRVPADPPDGILSDAVLYSFMDGQVCVRGSRPIRVTGSFHLPPSDTYFVRTDLLRAHGGWDADCHVEELELMALLRRTRPAVRGVLLYGEPARRRPPNRWLYFGHLPAAWESQRLALHAHRLSVLWSHTWRRPPRVRDRLFGYRTFLFPSLRGLVAASALWTAALLPFLLPALPPFRFALPFWVVGASVLANARAARWLISQTGGAQSPLSLTEPTAGGWLGNLRLLLTASARAMNAYPKYSVRKRAGLDRDPYEPHESESARGPAAPPPPPSDLLGVAGSPDTPAAAEAMADGLDTLFRALGPPPESMRLAQAGPPPQGGGSSDG